MPELPEVETIIRQLKPVFVGQKFWKFESKNDSSFLPSADELRAVLPGKKIENINRRGKYLIFDLSAGFKLVIHLRMTGMLTFTEISGKKKFVRGIFTFSSAKRLYFSDIRKFGKVYLYHQKEYLQKTGIGKLGKDPIVEDLFENDLEKFLLGKKGILKNKLLDQTNLAGIGNIYADEICFRAGLRPSTRTEKLRQPQIKKLHEAILFCLKEGIRNNGTTISDFVNVQGKAGRQQEKLRVYGRAGQHCRKCRTLIVKTRVAGRGTYYCPHCQK
jgi:formamidopyrimidine-DNA glycosylase